MRQKWRDLLFLHWPVAPESIQRLLPPGLTVDTHDGSAYIGLVPFGMEGVRPVWSPPVPGLSRFLEVNVRTYVYYEGANPGVYFFSLDAANLIAVHIARRQWQLPYYHAKMRQTRNRNGTICYVSTRRLSQGQNGEGVGCDITYQPTGTPAPAAPGTLSFFLAERYLLYANKNGALLRGQVHHTPYPLQPVHFLAQTNTLVAASGVVLPPKGNILPPLAQYAAGVDVEIFTLKSV